MKKNSTFAFNRILILVGLVFITSCFGIRMMPDGDTRDTITLDSNNHPIEYRGRFRGIQEIGWVPFVSSYWRVLSFMENSPATRYYENHYVYCFLIESDDNEYVAIDSAYVSNARGKQFPFHLVNRVPFGYMGSCDSIIHDGMVPIDSLPCVVMTGQY